MSTLLEPAGRAGLFGAGASHDLPSRLTSGADGSGLDAAEEASAGGADAFLCTDACDAAGDGTGAALTGILAAAGSGGASGGGGGTTAVALDIAAAAGRGLTAGAAAGLEAAGRMSTSQAPTTSNADITQAPSIAIANLRWRPLGGGANGMGKASTLRAIALFEDCAGMAAGHDMAPGRDRSARAMGEGAASVVA